MARESKRKRDERRFGKAERLADRIHEDSLDHRWVIPTIWPQADGPQIRSLMATKIGMIRKLSAVSHHVDMTNIAKYFYETSAKENWDWTNDFPGCRPPFSITMFEAARPGFSRIGDNVFSFDAHFPARWAVAVELLDPKDLQRAPDIPAIREGLVPLLDLPGLFGILRMTLVMEHQDGRILPPIGYYFLPIDRNGRILDEPQMIYDAPKHAHEMVRAFSREQGQFFMTACLAMSFMNCRGVSTEPVDQDGVIARERRKAKMRPFVRYHTIRVEAFRKASGPAGPGDPNAPKKALHIVSGHFAHYTEERPLFGRHVGRFWMSQHVRGSAEKGIVISDHEIDPPAKS